ncbi:penicillin-binding protein [Pseudonocardia sp. HH130629-09]|uniref:penicillin-binding protein n=1 Tax=Pseudonocardia sp. HH130629-09 TaxID=1641402 RepID=UPI0006CB166E|nr:penicillin-binding protein [Pseudonocardia sp. HH130629-09]ALE86017.1 penicillin-binding protein [Pseudonocardia sp. HH130629-09]
MRFPRRLLRPLGVLAGLCVLLGVITAGMAFPLVGGLGMLSNEAGDSVTSSSADLVGTRPPLTTTLTDSDGRPIAYLFDQNRTEVTNDQISTAMKGAMLAIEDRRFYEHDGVDWQGTLRAVVANSASGDVVQGASTITQQYVKNYMLYVDATSEAERLKATEQTPARKLKEARIALQLERQLSKDEILNRYLNIVFLGNGSYGVAAGARTYFNTTPDKLTVPQAAMLAGMVRSTTQFDPVQNPETALQRRNVVIDQMRQQQMIDDTQARQAMAAPIGVANPLVRVPNGCNGAGDMGFFCKYVVQYLTEAGFTEEQIQRGGYTIRTTLDRRAMEEVKRSLDNEVASDTPNVANVMSLVEPGKDAHRVLAMGSSRTFGLDADAEETSYGLPYQPVNLGAGSTYKIFTAATALEKGLGINYSMQVPPSGYASPIYVDGSGRPIPVGNASEGLPARMSMTDALAQSPNTAFIKLEEFTGVPDVVDMAVRLGMKSLATTPFVDPGTGERTDRSIAEVIKDQRLASFTLGVTPTSVLELANVGATLFSEGMWCPPTPIDSITDAEGEPVPITEEPCQQAVDPGLANTLVTGMSQDDISGTSAAAARAAGWTRPMAGKTGTTQQHKSAAFVGAIPEMAGAVITFDNSNRPRPLCDGGGAPFACGDGDIFGGRTPARTWYGAVTPLVANTPPTPLPPTDPRYLDGGAESRIPDVVGRSVSDARGELEGAGWQVTTRTVDNNAPEGTVVGQEPRGAALPGEQVTLQVSSGSVPAPPPPPGSPAPAPAPDSGPPPGRPDEGNRPPDGG